MFSPSCIDSVAREIMVGHGAEAVVWSVGAFQLMSSFQEAHSYVIVTWDDWRVSLQRSSQHPGT